MITKKSQKALLHYLVLTELACFQSEAHWGGAMQGNEVVDLLKYRDVDAESDGSAQGEPQYLAAGTELLLGQYKIDGYLNCGGFGITYFAQDSLQRRVVIKECFPSELVYRTGAAMAPRSAKFKNDVAAIVHHFVREAHRLANVRHDNIVHVHQIFEENDTAYMAMDYVDGPDLLDVLEGSATRFSPNAVQDLTRKMLCAIKFVHDHGMLHRDISPDNILIDTRGEPVLIDFGAAREHAQKNHKAMSKLKFVKDGYSPQEFYISGSEQGPWSDLYSFAATIYHVIAGYAPAEAQVRLAALAAKDPDPYEPLASRISGYPARFLKAIDMALNVIPDQRIQTADDWLAILPAASSKPNPMTVKPKSALVDHMSVAAAMHYTPKSKVALLVAGVAVLLVGGGIFLLPSGGAPEGEFAANSLVEPPSVVTGQETTADGASGENPAFANEPVQRPAEDVLTPSLDVDTLALTVPKPVTSPDVRPAPRPLLPIELGQSFPTPATDAPVDLTLDQPVPTFEAAGLSLTVPGEVATFVPFAAPVPPARTEMIVALPEIEVPAPVKLQVESLPGKLAVPINIGSLEATPLVGEPSATGLAAIVPVERHASLAELAAPTPDTSVSADINPPAAYVPKGSILDQQVAYSHWDVQMPFESVAERVRSADTITITDVSETADLSVSGEWIAEGVVIYSFNGERLIENTPLSVHVLKAMTVDPDGFARSTVRYRDPSKGVLDRALLAVPVFRETGLKDGTVLRSRQVGDAWVVEVASVGPNSGGLVAGDFLKSEATTGIEINDHEAIGRILDALRANAAPSANFTVLRNGSRQQAEWRLARGE